MIFTSKLYQVTKILKKTKAIGFKDLEIGDNIRFKIKLVNTLGGSNGIYALYIDSYNITKDKFWSNTQNDFLRFLSNFEIEEII